MNLVHRFPKWLRDERFEITHSPKLSEPFGVVLFNKVSARFQGCGHSVAEAAKEARQKREAKTEL